MAPVFPVFIVLAITLGLMFASYVFVRKGLNQVCVNSVQYTIHELTLWWTAQCHSNKPYAHIRRLLHYMDGHIYGPAAPTNV